MFSIGDRVVHPMHGAGIIDGIVEEKVSGDSRSYYVFRLIVGGLVLKIPVAGSSSIGLRTILDRDSVDPAVRERHRKFRQGLLGGALERVDYEWAAAALGFLRPQWWPEHEDHRALENALLKTRTLASKKE